MGVVADDPEALAGEPSAELKRVERQLASGEERAGLAAAARGASPVLKAESLSPWADTTANAAALVLGARPLLIAGAASTQYAVSVAGAPQVRVTQRLDDGTVVELIQQRAPVEAMMERAMAPAAQDRQALADLNQEADAVTVNRGGVLVTARVVITAGKAIGRDSLAGLLQKLR